jgi:hypothetical protein
MTGDQIHILTSDGNTIQDAVSTLILTIFLYFVGDPSHLKDKNIKLFSILDTKNSLTSNDIKRLFLLMSCSKKIQTNPSRKKNSLLVCRRS